MHRLLEALENRRLLSGSDSVGDVIPISAIVPVLATDATIGKPVTVHADATDQFTATVGRLRGGTASHVSQLSGTIDWGDGTDPSAATFQRASNGEIKVIGTHTYAKVGNYNITVGIAKRPFVPPGQPNPFFAIFLGDLKSKAKVTPDIDGGVTLHEVAGQRFTATVGDFDFQNVDLIFSAKIDWGDGHKSDGVLRGGSLANGEYDVIGTHKYAAAGTYHVHITIPSHLVGQTLPSGKIADFFSTIKVTAPV